MNKTLSNERAAYKAFHTAVASYILGEKSNIKIQGSPERIRATKKVIGASRALYEELNNPGASLRSVTKLLEEKRQASNSFQQVTGIRWLL